MNLQKVLRPFLFVLASLFLLSKEMLTPYELIEQDLQAYFALDSQKPQVSRITLHPAQRQVKREAKRFNVLCMGRRWGKTKYLCDLLIETAVQGFPAGYFAPSYKHLMDGWRDLLEMAGPLIAHKSDQEKRIELTTGGVVECWSLDGEGAGGQYKAGRSRRYKRVVVDEAALVPALKGIYEYAISPTLIDLQGDAWFGSTPSGRNGFHKFWLRGQSPDYPDWMSWRMPTVSNTTIKHLAQEVERDRLEKPDHMFRQEYLAEFLEDGGQVFRNISACTKPLAELYRDGLDPYHVYVIGWDLAKKEDFSVMTVIDCTTKSVVKIDRFNHVDYMLQTPRLVALTEAFQSVEDVVEITGNEAFVEMLQQTKYKKRGPAPRITRSVHNAEFSEDEILLTEAAMRRAWESMSDSNVHHMCGLPITAFNTTNASKEEAIQALVLAFERQEIQIPDDPVLIGELESFGMERLPSGRFRYSAPEGEHDDTVMSLAIGWYRARRYMSVENLPMRVKAMRQLQEDLRPENIHKNPSPVAEVSSQYWIHSYEKEHSQRREHFMNNMRGFGK